MAYNPRMSQQFRASNQRQKVTQKKEEDDGLLLTDKDIAGCINDMGLNFSPADLQKPNPQQIQEVFEWFAESLMGLTRETVEPAMRAAADDICGEYADVVPGETRNLMGFYISLRRLTVECGIKDFGFNDLIRPTHDRLVRIFSYLINFVRFRENHTNIIYEHLNKAEATKERIEHFYGENHSLEEKLENMKAVRLQLGGLVKRNEALRDKLLDMRSDQQKLTENMQASGADKNKLTKVLVDKETMLLTQKQEIAKLKPYVSSSPAALQASLVELSNALSADKASIEALDRRTRALGTSSDTFTTVTADVNNCSKTLEELAADINKEEIEAAKASRQREALSERSNNIREIERTEQLLDRQLAKWNERTEKLRLVSSEREREANKRMAELQAVHKALSEERATKNREVEIRRVKIEQVEKKMADLKDNIDNEVAAAREEFMKLNSHIDGYMTEMDKLIV